MKGFTVYKALTNTHTAFLILPPGPVKYIMFSVLQMRALRLRDAELTCLQSPILEVSELGNGFGLCDSRRSSAVSATPFAVSVHSHK